MGTGGNSYLARDLRDRLLQLPVYREVPLHYALGQLAEGVDLPCPTFRLSQS